VAQTRWLSENEQRTWRTFVQSTKLLFDQLEHELDEQTEVPSRYYEVLAALAEAPQRRMRMSDLADLSQSSRSRLPHSMARLESLGWIRREACETDRRGAVAVLTDEGLSAIEAAAPLHAHGVRTHFFDQLDVEQLEELRRIGERVLKHLVAVKRSSPEELEVLSTFVRAQRPDLHANYDRTAHRPRRCRPLARQVMFLN
jgi:DNA-binding MarR family transcriptional regulator